jgi:hypothetical protein
MKTKSLNHAGYLFIEKWVTENSINGKPDQRNMEYWCKEAESGRLEDDAIVELQEHNSITGRTETLKIPEQYFTYELLED